MDVPDADDELIREAVHRGRNARAIYQQLVDEHGFTANYESVKRYVRTVRREERPREAHPVIETAPGEECQVDWGEGPLVRDPKTGKYRRTRLFTMVLGFSRMAEDDRQRQALRDCARRALRRV